MAEIDLQQKKKGGGGWVPWILAAIVAVLAIWAIVELMDRDEPVAGDFDRATDEAIAPAPAAEMGAPGEQPGGAAIAEFRRTCVDEQTETPEMGVQHEYTTRCIETMAEAMSATIRADTVGSVALDERLTTLRQRSADVRQSDPSAVSHSETVAAAFDAGADLIETLHEERDRENEALQAEVQEVRQAADAVQPDQPLLEQREQVRQFFSEMAQALEAVGTRAP